MRGRSPGHPATEGSQRFDACHFTLLSGGRVNAAIVASRRTGIVTGIGESRDPRSSPGVLMSAEWLQHVRELRVRSLIRALRSGRYGVRTLDGRCHRAGPGPRHPALSKTIGVTSWSRWLLLPASTVGPMQKGYPSRQGRSHRTWGLHRGSSSFGRPQLQITVLWPPISSAPESRRTDVTQPGAIGTPRCIASNCRSRKAFGCARIACWGHAEHLPIHSTPVAGLQYPTVLL